jgi:hypothetical protein
MQNNLSFKLVLLQRSLFPAFALALVLFAYSAAFCANPIPATPSEQALSKPAEGAINTADFCRHWLRSMEEEKTGGNEQIFRPADYKNFPPSRFRMQYKFDPNGDCMWLYLAPNDAHSLKPGKWSIDERDKSIVRIQMDSKTEAFRITKLTREILCLVPTKTTE